MKENRKIVIASCLLCLVPLIFRWRYIAVCRNRWRFTGTLLGEANGCASRFVGALGCPPCCWQFSCFCCAGILYDPKKRNQSSVMRNIGIWCIPVLNLIIHPIMLLSAMGKSASDYDGDHHDDRRAVHHMRELHAENPAELLHRNQAAVDAGRQR